MTTLSKIILDKNSKTVRVPHAVWKAWSGMKEQGDIKAISEQTGVDEKTISRAFNDRTAQKELQFAITTFFANRKEKRKLEAAASEESMLKMLGEDE